jgi:dTDP-4-amino-4,6-dideoxygalactose transaminase
MIQTLDLKKQLQQVKVEIFEAFEKVYEKSAFAGGEFVEQFEKSFATYSDSKYCVGVSNGTTALHLAHLALGIGAGDEVIVAANTFIASAWGVSHAGATPVFVDCDATWNIDISQIEAAITPKTKAIIGVHLYGQTCDLSALRSICDQHHLFLIEDAAQAHGAYYQNKRVGSWGDIACFSFYPGKNLGACGEGGGITCQEESYYEKLKSLRNHGSKVRYFHDEIGYNYRMGGLEGASLSVKLKYLDSWNAARKAIAHRYKTEIHNSKITFQEQPDWADSVHHLMVVTVENKAALVEHLKNFGVNPAFHYPVPCHLQKAYSYLNYQVGDLPNSEYLANHAVTIPMYAELEEGEINTIIQALNEY